jgi:hypothetical protein
MNTVLLERIEAKVKAGEGLTYQEERLYQLSRMIRKYCNSPVEREILEALSYLVENTPPMPVLEPKIATYRGGGNIGSC